MARQVLESTPPERRMTAFFCTSGCRGCGLSARGVGIARPRGGEQSAKPGGSQDGGLSRLAVGVAGLIEREAVLSC